MQCTVQHLNPIPQNTTELRSTLQNAWCSLSTEYFHKLAEYIPTFLWCTYQVLTKCTSFSSTSVYNCSKLSIIDNIAISLPANLENINV